MNSSFFLETLTSLTKTNSYEEIFTYQIRAALDAAKQHGLGAREKCIR
jgi:hypothetical protein